MSSVKPINIMFLLMLMLMALQAGDYVREGVSRAVKTAHRRVI
jgi:hypothetical protein